MSAAVHTPGPWVVTIEDYGQVIRGAEVEQEQHGIKFQFRDYVGSTWGRRNDTTDANARLMAAAPTMLQALGHAKVVILLDRMALADAHMDPTTNTLDEEGQAGVAEYDCALALIDAAIAAATGAAS